MSIIKWWKEMLEESREYERQENRDNDPEYARLIRENAELVSRNLQLESLLTDYAPRASHLVEYQKLIDREL